MNLEYLINFKDALMAPPWATRESAIANIFIVSVLLWVAIASASLAGWNRKNRFKHIFGGITTLCLILNAIILLPLVPKLSQSLLFQCIFFFYAVNKAIDFSRKMVKEKCRRRRIDCQIITTKNPTTH